MQVLLARATNIEGIEQIVLSVTTTQPPAVRLYQSFGFRSFGREHRALRIGNRYVDEEYMVLEVEANGALAGPAAPRA